MELEDANALLCSDKKGLEVNKSELEHSIAQVEVGLHSCQPLLRPSLFASINEAGTSNSWNVINICSRSMTH